MDGDDIDMISLNIIRYRCIQRLARFNKVHQQEFGIGLRMRMFLDNLTLVDNGLYHLRGDFSFAHSLTGMLAKIVALSFNSNLNFAVVGAFHSCSRKKQSDFSR